MISIKTPLFTDHAFRVQTSGSQIYCCHSKKPENVMKEYSRPDRTHLLKPSVIRVDEESSLMGNTTKKNLFFMRKNRFLEVQSKAMAVLCGFGYYVNGFRGFPWLALNYHMSQNLHMHPSTLQLIQNTGNLPMVAKPIYGILSDTLSFGSSGRRVPYITTGVFLQVVSWGSLALIPNASEAFPMLLGCVLLSNLGASISEVAKDALTAEYGQKNKISGLQSYAFMLSAFGGILGNLLGGFFLLKTQQTKWMFLIFAAILTLQLTLSSTTREESLGLYTPENSLLPRESIPKIIQKQYSILLDAIKEEGILRPLIWIVSSIVIIPILSGSLFCYQTQCLNLDPSIIGLSKVTGQLLLFSFTILYNRFWKPIPLRNLARNLQLLYAFSLLLDLLLVKQLNSHIGIPNEAFVLCFSGLSETIAQFKLLPFHVYFASLAPSGSEASLMSFLAAALCLSSIFSGFLGVALASFLGISYGNYSNLPFGITMQFIAALLPILWIDHVPMSHGMLDDKSRRIGRSKRNRRNRRVGRIVFDFVQCYRRERESDPN